MYYSLIHHKMFLLGLQVLLVYPIAVAGVSVCACVCVGVCLCVRVSAPHHFGTFTQHATIALAHGKCAWQVLKYSLEYQMYFL